MTQRQYFVAGDSKTLITLNYVTRLCATGKTRASFLQASTSLHQHCHLLLFLSSLLAKKHEAPTHVHTCNQPYITCHLLCYCFLLCWRLLPFPCCKVVRYCVASIAIISYKVGLSDCPFMFVCVCVHGGWPAFTGACLCCCPAFSCILCGCIWKVIPVCVASICFGIVRITLGVILLLFATPQPLTAIALLPFERVEMFWTCRWHVNELLKVVRFGEFFIADFENCFQSSGSFFWWLYTWLHIC